MIGPSTAFTFRILVLLALSALTPSQDIVPFGAGCGARGTALEVYGSPTPGGAIEFHLGAAAPFAPHILVLGFSRTNWNGTPLPWIPPASYGFAPGCALLVSLDLTTGIAVGAGGAGFLPLPLDPSLGAMSFHVQALGLPNSEPLYGTAGISIDIVAAPPVALSGLVRRVGSGAPVPAARLTAFSPALGVFYEARSDATGAYSLMLPRGRYRIGCAAPGLDYAEIAMSVPAAGAVRDFTLQLESHPGEWNTIGDTSPETLDATDIAILLPDGRILYCHDTIDPILFDPVTGAKGLPAGSGLPQGCMNTTLLEDGRAILIGGQDGASPGQFTNASRLIKTWSPSTGWLRLADLLNVTGRWYPGLARLRDGRLLVMGGGTRPNAVRTNTCEVFDQATGTCSFTGSMGQAVEFPPAALLHTGRVLRTWGGPELYDPASGTWSPTGALVAPNRGWPGHSDHSLVVLRDGSAIIVGVGTNQAGVGASMVERYTPATGTWTARSSPSLKRSQAEVVPLPDGRVFVQGGDVTNQSTTEPTLFGCVRRCDVYDPMLDTWRRVANTAKFREYHAVTLLVPDGRVVTTGGTNIKFQNTPLSADVDAWSPPYLFRGVRPRLDNLSANVLSRGAVVSFTVFPATQLTGVVLMGTGSTTHWVDGGVPRQLLLAVQQNGAAVSCTLPTDPDLLPVGHYLLFAMVDDIPSVAAIVRVQP